MEQLTAQGKGIIYISHILGDVRKLADRIAVMRDGELVALEAADNFPISRMISLMVGRSIEQLYPPRTSAPTDKSLLEVRGVRTAGIVENISFQLKAGEVLGLFGLMGSGRTELARMIFGMDPFDSGSILVEGEPLHKPSPRASIRSKIAFVTENRCLRDRKPARRRLVDEHRHREQHQSRFSAGIRQQSDSDGRSAANARGCTGNSHYSSTEEW